MKNTLFLFLAAFLFATAVNAQTTVDSIQSKYTLLPMPGALTLEKAFPVLGAYQLASADSTGAQVTITMDSASKGIVWVEGLPQGKFKAYLKRSPGTYRVVAQKTASGTQIPEGTLLFDPTTNNLSIALGKKFDEVDPTAIFNMNGDVVADNGATEVKVKTKNDKTKAKTKTKVVFYNATKVDQSMVSGTQQPQQDQ